MAQLSRPVQIALLAAAVLAGVLLFTLQRSSSTTSGSGSTPAVSASAPTTSAPGHTAAAQGSASNKAAATPAHVSHGSGSSLGGLSHAIDRAHHAAAITQQNNSHLAEKSAQASNEAAPAQTSSTATHAPAASTTAAAPASSSAAKTSPTHSGTTVPTGQRAVEADLAKGDVVVLLFWNPAGTEDTTVHRAVQALSNAHKQIAVQEATAGQVANFGSITRGVQVYATPTILVINKQGKTLVLTGVQDAFSIEQAIAEARSS
jgi:hypothetical protein